MRVLIIIPAYNEEKSIVRTVESLKNRYDYIIVNDCSRDSTKEKCIKNNYNYLDLPINLGIGGGVQTGYMYAKENNYDIAIQFDGDGQHDAEYIQQIIEPIISGKANVVIGSRYINKEGFQSSYLRRLGINFFEKLIKLLTKEKITDATSGFRAVDRSVILFFSETYPRDYPEPESNVALILRKYKVKEVPVIMNAREEGESSITTIKSVYYMIKVTMAILLDYYKYK